MAEPTQPSRLATGDWVDAPGMLTPHVIQPDGTPKPWWWNEPITLPQVALDRLHRRDVKVQR